MDWDERLPVSPSELVVLYGDRFVARPGRWYQQRTPVPMSGRKIADKSLCKTAQAALVLSCRELGCLESGGMDAPTFGFRSTRGFVVWAEGAGYPWPPASFEARISAYLREHHDHETRPISLAALFYEVFGEGGRWGWPLRLIQRSLAERGLVAKRSTVRELYHVPEDCRRLLEPHAENAIAAIEDVLAHYRSKRPSYWKRLDEALTVAAHIADPGPS